MPPTTACCTYIRGRNWHDNPAAGRWWYDIYDLTTFTSYTLIKPKKSVSIRTEDVLTMSKYENLIGAMLRAGIGVGVAGVAGCFGELCRSV